MAMMTFAQGALNCNCSLAPAEQDALVRLFSTAQVSVHAGLGRLLASPDVCCHF
jgi:hypothetical protein